MSHTYIVRALDLYRGWPAAPLRVGSVALLEIDAQGLAWSAVHCPEHSEEQFTEDGLPIGEISWLRVDEIVFLSALALAEPWPETNGALWPTTIGLPATITFDQTPDELPVDVLVERSRTEAHRIHGELGVGRPIDTPHRLAGDYHPEVVRLLAEMAEAPHLLIRGLYKFLMALELRVHPKFLEEAALSAFISREAALELLRRKLSDSEGKRLRHDDVLGHIEKSFPSGKAFADVLRSDWGARVLMAHPTSEYGEYWSPPIEADECFESLYSCVHLYRYLLLGEVWEPPARNASKSA